MCGSVRAASGSSVPSTHAATWEACGCGAAADGSGAAWAWEGGGGARTERRWNAAATCRALTHGGGCRASSARSCCQLVHAVMWRVRARASNGCGCGWWGAGAEPTRWLGADGRGASDWRGASVMVGPAGGGLQEGWRRAGWWGPAGARVPSPACPLLLAPLAAAAPRRWLCRAGLAASAASAGGAAAAACVDLRAGGLGRGGHSCRGEARPATATPAPAAAAAAATAAAAGSRRGPLPCRCCCQAPCAPGAPRAAAAANCGCPRGCQAAHSCAPSAGWPHVPHKEGASAAAVAVAKGEAGWWLGGSMRTDSGTGRASAAAGATLGLPSW